MAPIAASTPPAAPPAVHDKAPATTSGRGWQGYTVRLGDTLDRIAAAHGTTPAALQSQNRLGNPNVLKVGQRLQVPGPRPARSAAPKITPKRSTAVAKTPVRIRHVYTVRAGESLSSIAAANHLTLSAVLKANRIPDPDLVQPGRRIWLPGPAPAAHHEATTRRTTASKARSTTSVPRHLTIKERTFAGRVYPESVVRAAQVSRATLSRHTVPTRTQTRALIVQTARRYGVDPKLALGIGWQESGWNQRAVSVCNAVGVMQVMPDSGTWASGMVGRHLNLLDAKDNVTAGVAILRYLTSHAHGLDQAIGGYYQGLGGVQRNGMAPDTKQYVASVRAHMSRL